MMKKLVILTLILSFSLFLYACDNTDYNRRSEQNSDDLIELTIEELAQYDGQDGRLAYIAVNGNIYDVTNSSRWNDGVHTTTVGVTAGRDLTEELGSSPHGVSVLGNVPQIGIIIESRE